MTKWFAYFKGKALEPFFRLLTAKDLSMATLIAGELAARDKIEFLGASVAPKSFQEE